MKSGRLPVKSGERERRVEWVSSEARSGSVRGCGRGLLEDGIVQLGQVILIDVSGAFDVVLELDHYGFLVSTAVRGGDAFDLGR